MNVKQAIEKRRAYRILEKGKVDENLINELAKAAQLAPSCFNKQPWRLVFVDAPEPLDALQATLMKGNEWAQQASMMIAVFSRKDLDCRLKKRTYYLFDTGLAVGQLMLRATELGWVAHPIAGYDEEAAKTALNIPDDMRLITLLVIGKPAQTLPETLSEKERHEELNRPPRLPFSQFAYRNRFSE